MSELSQAPANPSPFDPGSLVVQVLRPDAEPIVQAIVSIRRGELESRQGVTDKNGIIQFDKLSPGSWSIRCEAGGMGRAATQPFKIGAADDTVNVAPGAEPSEFRFVMTPPLGFLSVLVRDKQLKPMAKVPVRVAGGAPVPTNAAGIALFGPRPVATPLQILAGHQGKPTAKPFFARSPAAPDAVKFQPAESTAILAIGEVRQVPMQLEEFKLQFVKVDDHFAPSVESLDIRYAIKGLAKRKVVLTIEAEQYPGKIVVQRELGDGERADGENNLIAFTGKIEVGSGKDGFIHPLLGPFKVSLLHEDADKFNVLHDEKPFKVLYHSLELHFGQHTPDETEPPEATELNKFVQFKLNTLNYDAGAVNGTLGTVGANAIRRFQRAHYVVGSQTLLTINGLADAATVAAIKAATPRPVWQDGRTPLTQDARYYVHDNFYNDRGANFALGVLAEFGSMNRKLHAEDKMERPFIALEAEVKLMNKAGNAVSAPQAVGPVPVAWEVADTPEDAAQIPAANALAQTYVRHAREIGTTAAVAGAARIDTNGDNALDTLDGIRNTTPATYIATWFPNSAESVLAPYAIARYDTEARAAKTFHRAVVLAWADPSKHPKRLGRAGLYFRHSKIAGDTAKLRVALTFKGLPNQAQLDADHAKQAGLVKETGTWTVWRRSRISAYCQMAAPTRKSGTPDWAAIAGRYAEAFIEFENGGAPLQILNYSTVVNAARYNAAILALAPAQRPPGVASAANLTYRPDCLYGGPFPPRPQAPGEAAMAYVQSTGNTMVAWITRMVNSILELVYLEARKTSPEGYVILDFRTHQPISGQDWDATLGGGAGGFKPTANPAARNFVNSHRGFDLIDGAVTMSVDNPYDVNCYLAHENGHARFLTHHKFTDAGAASATPNQHDDLQDRCIMSYTVPPDSPDKWTYHFCGKCLLRLRGWNVTLLPNKYT